MMDNIPESVRVNDPGHSATEYQPFKRFLRAESPWSWRAWVFFGCALAFCTAEGNPSWTHPSVRLGWPLWSCFGIIAVAGAITGLVVARIRLLGFLAGAVAGSGSLLALVMVFQGYTHFPRYAAVIVEMLGLLPGVALYCVLHLIVDLGRAKPQESE
jgi:hypothetical protein